MTEHGDQFGAGGILTLPKGPAERGRRPEHVEQLRRDRDARNQAHRTIASARASRRPERYAATRWNPGNCPRSVANSAFVPRSAEPEHPDLLFARDRQRVEQQRAHHAENRGGAAATEGQRQHGENGVGRDGSGAAARHIEHP